MSKQVPKANKKIQRISPFLWFDHQAEDAARFYTSIFRNSKVGAVTRYGPLGPGPDGSVMTVAFELDGQKFAALNGGPHFKFTEAISFVVNCETQAEVDEYWEKLSQGGQEVQCGWLKDKFGVSWQIVPSEMDKMMSKGTPEQLARVTKAFLKMKKFDLGELQKAYKG